MNVIKMLDDQADEMLGKIGISNKKVQDMVEVGAIVVILLLAFKLYRRKNGKKSKKN